MLNPWILIEAKQDKVHEDGERRVIKKKITKRKAVKT